MRKSNDKINDASKEDYTAKGKSKGKSKSTRARRSTCRRDDSSNPNRNYGSSDGHNDPSWYTNNMALVNNAGTFSFNNAAGAPLQSVTPSGKSWTIQGVFEYVVQMIPGISDNPYSPINIAARSLYDRVNYKNSRNFTYDAPDLMMYVYASSSAYAYWAWMVRLYGIMNTYSQINRYVPDVLVRATGANPDSIRLNMAQFRYYINLYARKINVLAIPQGMPIFNRYMWLFSNVYMDTDNAKAGLYISRPYGFYKYLDKTKTGGACFMTPIKDSMTIEDIIQYGDELAEAILSSQDMNNISTDVLKAFESNVMSLPDLAADYYVTPTYNQEVLEQIHNMQSYGDYIIGGSSTGDDGVITVTPSGHLLQDPTTGYLKFEMELADKTFYAKLSNTNMILDSYKANPTPEDVFVMSRFMAYTNYTTGDLECAGSDIVLKCRVWNLTNAGQYLTTYTEVPSSLSGQNAWLKSTSYAGFDKFDYSPLNWTVFTDSTGIKGERICGDVFNYTALDKTSLYKLHEAALLSLFTVPGALGSK